MNEELYDMLISLPKQSMLNVMLAALDEMEGYNGQSKTSAIMRAVGAEESEDGRSWRPPAAKTIAREFRENFPILG